MGDDQACERCDGCGQVANTADAEPWTEWEALPFSAAVMVRAGLVRPVPCPACNGSGKANGAASDE